MALYKINNEIVDRETWMSEVDKAIHNVLPLFKEMMEEVPKTRISIGPTGFDAKVARDQFLKKVNTRNLTPDDNPGLEDLFMFISLFLRYGNNVNKALRELKQSEIIKYKCLQYGIETGAPKQRKARPGQLSLFRLALAFPIQTAAVILGVERAGILPYSSLIMQHSIFPGLIPAGKFTEELKGIDSILNMEISVLLAMKARRGTLSMDWIKETVEELVESSAKFVNSSIDNGIEDERKLEALTKAGILESNAEGELELSAGTVALVNKLAGLKAVYSLPYNEAIKKLNSDSD